MSNNKCLYCDGSFCIQPSGLCIDCENELITYISHCMEQIKQIRQKIHEMSLPEDRLKQLQEIESIYQEIYECYKIADIDALAIYDPTTTMHEALAQCRIEIKQCQDQICEQAMNENIEPPAPDVEPSTSATPHYCKYCGKPVDADSIFCPYCGKKLISDDSSSQSIVKSNDVSSPAEVQTSAALNTPPSPSAPSVPKNSSESNSNNDDTPDFIKQQRAATYYANNYPPSPPPTPITKKDNGGCMMWIVKLLIFIGILLTIISLLVKMGVIDEKSQNHTSTQTQTQAQTQKQTQPKAKEAEKEIDYKKIGHDYGIAFVKLYCEQNGIYKYSRLGWYYPEQYTVKDGVHYTSSKFDYYNTDHTYVIGIEYDAQGNPNPIYFSVDDVVMTPKDK